MPADAYAGFGRLYEANRKGGLIIDAACWEPGRLKFFDLARLSKAPIAAEAVKRIEFRHRARDQRFYCAGAFACARSVAVP